MSSHDPMIEHYAHRLLGAQDVRFGTVHMNRGDGPHPVPPEHVAAVLHALADHTMNKFMVDIIVDQEVLAQDDRGQSFEPRVTSLGRWFHRLADTIEMDLFAQEMEQEK